MAITIEAGRDAQILVNSLERELKLIEHSIAKSKEKLKGLEKKAKMSSKEFYKKFEEGETGDSQETMLWASEYEALKFLEEDKQAVQRMLKVCKG